MWQGEVKFFYWVSGYIWFGYTFGGFIKSYKDNKVDYVSLGVLAVLFCAIIFDEISGFDFQQTFISLLVIMFLYPFFQFVKPVWLIFIGKNTLLIFLFHVYFINLAKISSGMLMSVDRSGFLFLLVSLVVSVTGPLIIGMVIDRLAIGKYVLGTSHAVK
ncbi:hypothetical protein ACPF34_003365 [Vibrio cholerae]